MCKNEDWNFEQAYAAFRDRLFWQAYHILGDEEAAKDVVNDTYVEAMLHRNWWGEQNEHVREKYLADTCERLSHMQLGKRGRLKYFDAEWEELIGGGEHIVEQAVVRESLRQYMAELSEEDRRILELRYFENYEMTQIAEHEGITVANAHKRLSRSRKRLKKIIEKPLPDSENKKRS